MDLSVSEVAELFDVSLVQLEKWLVEGKIPHYKIREEVRFDKMQIEDWLFRHQQEWMSCQRVSLGEKKLLNLRGSESKRGMHQFCLYRALHRGGMYKGVLAKTKEEAIHVSVSLIASQLGVDPDIMAELLLDREQLMSTGIGRGVAIPHTRECFGVSADTVSLVILDKPIEYGALDGKPVDLLFFVFASEDKTHLQLLSKIAHLSSDEARIETLRQQMSKPELLSYIFEWEATLQT